MCIADGICFGIVLDNLGFDLTSKCCDIVLLMIYIYNYTRIIIYELVIHIISGYCRNTPLAHGKISLEIIKTTYCKDMSPTAVGCKFQIMHVEPKATI